MEKHWHSRELQICPFVKCRLMSFELAHPCTASKTQRALQHGSICFCLLFLKKCTDETYVHSMLANPPQQECCKADVLVFFFPGNVNSLRRYSGNFSLFFYCVTQETERGTLSLPGSKSLYLLLKADLVLFDSLAVLFWQ